LSPKAIVVLLIKVLSETGNELRGRSLSSRRKAPIEKAAKLIRELGIRKLSDAENYEKCEAIARLAPQEVISLINDLQLREGLTLLKKIHSDIPSIAKWRGAFARTIQLFFREVGGVDRVKKWHELEGICERISEKELKNVDGNLKKAVTLVQYIHYNSSERMVNVVRKINDEIDRL
jgi:hypothetical protein